MEVVCMRNHLTIARATASPTAMATGCATWTRCSVAPTRRPATSTLTPRRRTAHLGLRRMPPACGSGIEGAYCATLVASACAETTPPAVQRGGVQLRPGGDPSASLCAYPAFVIATGTALAQGPTSRWRPLPGSDHDRYRLHVNLPEADRVSAVFGFDEAPMTVSAPAGIFAAQWLVVVGQRVRRSSRCILTWWTTRMRPLDWRARQRKRVGQRGGPGCGGRRHPAHHALLPGRRSHKLGSEHRCGVFVVRGCGRERPWRRRHARVDHANHHVG